MRAVCEPAGVPAISPSVIPDVETEPDGFSAKSDACDRGWFVEMVRALLPRKAGTALHFLTGYDERLCQKYAAGSVKPSAFFIRNLLRSEQGQPVLAAIMDGCEAQWWLDHQQLQRKANRWDRVVAMAAERD